jgi:transcriptional regulator of arginine metabolism
MTAPKAERLRAIRDIVAAHAVASQHELRERLRARGVVVTQSTLSRDLRELGLARVGGAGGAVWALLDGTGPEPAADEPALAALLPQLFLGLEGTGVLAVLKTRRGSAQPIAEALDAERWPDILGTIAGDDTILIITRAEPARRRVERRLRELAGPGVGTVRNGARARAAVPASPLPPTPSRARARAATSAPDRAR